MPEGHTVHRLAGQIARRFGGLTLAVDSPQGRFTAGAALLDGRRLARTDAHGKHLFVGFVAPDAAARAVPRQWLHVHLGLYGKWIFGLGEPPAVRGALRLRWQALDVEPPEAAPWAELRGPTACEVLDPVEVAAVRARLGPDPLRKDADRAQFVARVRATRTSVAALLMNQEVLAGVGNVYRAEVLFRAGLDPATPGRDVPTVVLEAIWDDLVTLMRAGVRAGRIVTTEASDRGGQRGRVGASYVYRRAGLPCRRCGGAVVTAEVAGRNLFWCPTCQAPGAADDDAVVAADVRADAPEAAAGAAGPR